MYSESISHHMSQQYRMSNRYIALLLLALLSFTAHSQDAAQQNAATAEAPKVDTPPPQTASPSQEPQKAEVTPAAAADDYVARINKIRESVANSKDLDHKYLEQKINEVIASLTPQQKEQFESGLSSEARAAYEHYRQERQRELQKQHEQYRQMEGAAAELSLSEQTLKRELDELKQFEEIKQIKHKHNDYHFQVDTMKSEDLQFTLPIDQQVAFLIRVFTDDNGIFGTVTNIEGEQPIRVYVYENRDRIVADSSFYSFKLLKFQGRANATYLIRFSNNGKKRLLALYMSHILLDAHVGTKLTVEDVADHGLRIREIRDNIESKLQEQKDKMMLQKENEKRLITAFGHYYFYNIGEIVLLGIICVIQVESIRKLLISSSVV